MVRQAREEAGGGDGRPGDLLHRGRHVLRGDRERERVGGGVWQERDDRWERREVVTCSVDEHLQTNRVRGQSQGLGLVCDVVVCLFWWLDSLLE